MRRWARSLVAVAAAVTAESTNLTMAAAVEIDVEIAPDDARNAKFPLRCSAGATHRKRPAENGMEVCFVWFCVCEHAVSLRASPKSSVFDRKRPM